MDPPSYGRGPGGEVWKLEEQIYPLVADCIPLLSKQPLFFLLNSYTAGLSPAVMKYLLGILVSKRFGGKLSSDEIGLPVTQSGLVLPCGGTAVWQAE
jgi:23S rRNA (cytosine1962-C5)-methyltransferase